MSDRDVAVAEASVRFWNGGERESFLALWHPEGVWSSAIKRQVEGGEGLYRGREEIARFWDEWHAVWAELELIVAEVRAADDGRVFAWGAIRSSGKGSGVETERPFAWALRIEDGLIREGAAYLDREEALEAAGLSSRPEHG
jgi:ketosteroid isomerase-like protein